MSEYIKNFNARRFCAHTITVITIGMALFPFVVSAGDRKNENMISIDNIQIASDRYNEIKEAFEAAEKVNRIDTYEQFISTYPGSLYEKVAKSKLEYLEFKDAVSQRTVEALDAFMGKYPESMNFRSAKYKRARLLDDVDEYNAYLLEYPDAEGVEYYRDRAALKAAKKIGTLEAFNEFIEFYPDSDWLDQVIYERDKAALKVAKQIGTQEAFGEFIELYPDSDWLDRAKYFYKHGYDYDD